MPSIEHDDFVVEVIVKELLVWVPIKLGAFARNKIGFSIEILLAVEFGVEHSLFELRFGVNNCVDRMDSSIQDPIGAVMVEMKVNHTSFERPCHKMLDIVVNYDWVVIQRKFVELVVVD